MIKKLVFTGDIMSFIPQNKAAWKGDYYDYSSVFKYVKPIFTKADVVIGNLETPIAGEELRYTYEKTVFNTPVEFAMAAKEAGIDIVTLANNHCFDRGYEGLKNTIRNLDNIGLKHTGCYATKEDSEEIFVIDFGDSKISLLSFTYGTNSEWRGCVMDESNDYMVDLFRKQDAQRTVPTGMIPTLKKIIKPFIPKQILYKRQKLVVNDSVESSVPAKGDERYIAKMNRKIALAKEKSDFVIMCMHSGGQFNDTLGDYTRDLTYRIIKQGCDACVGNHSHSILPFTFVDNKPVIYSLGNFSWSPGYSVYRKEALSEYSVLYNMYYDTEKKSVSRITATILKCVVESDKGSVVYPLAELRKHLSHKASTKLDYDFLNIGKRIHVNIGLEDIEKEEILL